MKQLFNLLLNQYPLIISAIHLDELVLSHEKELLLKASVLEETKHLTAIDCPECGRSNDIRFDASNNMPYYVCSCPNGGRIELNENEIKNYAFQLEKLFEMIGTALSSSNLPTELKKGKLWNVGKVQNNSKVFDLFLYRGPEILEDNKLPLSTYAYKVILYFGQSQVLQNKDFYINLHDLLVIGQNKISFSGSVLFDFIQQNIKEIILESNGDLIISQENACNLKSDTPEYLYFKYLYNNFNKPLSIFDIHRFVESKYKKIKYRTRWTYEDDQELFCRKMKSSIKSKINNETLKNTFDNCLIPTRINIDGLAYKLGNPSS